MDARGSVSVSVSVVPPAGAPPPPSRAKSLRQQRASNGATVIKAYVRQSEQRREQSKFHAARGGTPRAGDQAAFLSPRGDERWEEPHPCALSPRASTVDMVQSIQNNQQHHEVGDNDVHALDALFSDRRIRRSRRPSVVTQGRQPLLHVGGPLGHAGTDHASGGPAAIKPVLRRRLQMETVTASLHAANGPPSGSNHHAHGHRPVVPLLVPHHPRARHNLGAKLDALAKTSMLNRRKVVLGGDEKAVKQLTRNLSPRHANNGAVSGQGVESHHGSKDAESETESRVMTAFRQIVRLWRERKRRAEAAALNKMNGGNTGGIATGTGRNGSKLRKDLAAQQSNVVGIISKRLIREIPALKFFDEETETLQNGTAPPGGVLPKPAAAATNDRTKPRGVCYTLDAFGCRKIKMQSSTTIAEPTRQQSINASSHKPQKTGGDELTLEKAMHRSLHRKMARRIKARRQTILRLGDEFSKSRNDLAMKLRSQLALQHAQIEKMFSKRLTLLMTDDTSLPPYMAQKELHLARVRCRKANLLEKCETLRVLGLVLKHVEAAGNASGMEVSTGELHFLDLFRCVVEENHVLTPIISNAIRQHMRNQDLKQPLIMELFRALDTEMHHHEQTE